MIIDEFFIHYGFVTSRDPNYFHCQMAGSQLLILPIPQMSKEITANGDKGLVLFHNYISVLVQLLTTPHRRQISAVMQYFQHLANTCSVILGEGELITLFKKILVAGEQEGLTR